VVPLLPFPGAFPRTQSETEANRRTPPPLEQHRYQLVVTTSRMGPGIYQL
jgi:hypothetical protein